MSENKHASVHESPIKTPRQLVTVIALGFMVPVVIIVLLSQFFANIRDVDRDSPAMTHEAVAKRLKPVGDVAFADAGGAAEAVAATGAAKPEATTGAAKAEAAAGAAKAGTTTGAAAGKADGRKIYETSCAACHGAGVAGAPKSGDNAAWAPRLKTGVNTLYASALKGKGAMPPKGGNAALSEAEVNAAVDYLMSLAK